MHCRIIFAAFGAAFVYCVLMLIKQGECPKCEDRGDYHGVKCVVRKLIFERDFKGRAKSTVTREQAMNLAVRSIEEFHEREKERKKMSETKNEVVVKPPRKLDYSAIDNHMVNADINLMNQDQISSFIRKLCEFVAINPITRPFDIIPGQGGKKFLYANKGCAEQLRSIWSISIRIVKREVVEGVYVVTAAAQMPDGRVDESTGCVWIDGVKGEARANAMMKAETKAKRRVTLSICGLNMPDESEVESIPGVKKPAQVLPASPEKPKSWGPSPDQITRMFAIAKVRGILSKDDLKIWISNKFNFFSEGSSLTDLTLREYDEVCMELEKKSEPTEVKEFHDSDPMQEEALFEESLAQAPGPKPKNPSEKPWDKYLEK